MFSRALGFILAGTLTCSHAHAIDLNLPADQRPQIRNQIQSCTNFFVSAGQIDDSVGIPFTADSPQAFRDQLQVAIAKDGIEHFRNGTFFVLGKPMQRRNALRRQYQDVLNDLGLASVGAKVKVMTVPSRLVERESVNLATHVLERLRYFFPSIHRDYQTPQRGEVVSGYITTAAMEVPTVIFLYQSMIPLDANVTVLAHAITLGALTIYSKTFMNWLLRSGTRDARLENVEIFLRQMLISLPFVLNYSVFGNLTEILNYYSIHGMNGIVQAFPAEFASFVTTQGMTLVLQTLFYSQVITNGFGRWVDRQVGEANSSAARSLRPWLQTPVLMLDATLLAMASSNWGEPLLAMGPMEFNIGHAALLALTATGVVLFDRFPRALNSTLPLYRRVESLFQNYSRWMNNPSQEFQSPVFTDPNWGLPQQTNR